MVPLERSYHKDHAHVKYDCSAKNTLEDMAKVNILMIDKHTDEWVSMSSAFVKLCGTK